MKTSLLLLAISTFIVGIAAECNMFAFSNVDVYTMDKMNNFNEQENVNFNAMSGYNLIYIRQAKVPKLCKGMIKYSADIEVLCINGANISEMETKVFQDIPNLTKLHLSRNKLKVIKPEYFNLVKKLKVLDLSDNEIEVVEEGSFHDMSSLERIYLNMNRLGAINGEWFKGCPNLYLVDLSHNKIVTIPANVFPNIVPRPDNSLVLDSNRITCVSEEILRELRSRLISLNLENNPIACDCVEKFEKFGNVTEVSFQYSTTSDCKVPVIGELNLCTIFFISSDSFK